MILDTTHDRAIDLMLGSALTTHPVDNAKAVLLLRATNGDYIVRKMILAKRAAWRTRQTLVQREWQAKISRRLSRQRVRYSTEPSPERLERDHRAALATRERYVRCA